MASRMAPGTITVTLLTRRTGVAASLSSDKVWSRDHSWSFTFDQIEKAKDRARTVDAEFNTGFRIPGKEFKVTCKRTAA